MTTSSVKIDLKPMGKLSRMIRAGSPEMARILKKAALRYMTAMSRRFDRLSKGSFQSSAGGDGSHWTPLAESTIKARRQGKKKRHATVARRGEELTVVTGRYTTLVDTGTLKRALLYGSPGNMIQTTGQGIKAGIGGGSHDGGMTIGELAAIHHEGNPARGLPARPVMTVDLDQQTKDGIARDAMSEARKVIASVAHA